MAICLGVHATSASRSSALEKSPALASCREGGRARARGAAGRVRCHAPRAARAVAVESAAVACLEVLLREVLELVLVVLRHANQRLGLLQQLLESHLVHALLVIAMQSRLQVLLHGRRVRGVLELGPRGLPQRVQRVRGRAARCGRRLGAEVRRRPLRGAAARGTRRGVHTQFGRKAGEAQRGFAVRRHGSSAGVGRGKRPA